MLLDDGFTIVFVGFVFWPVFAAPIIMGLCVAVILLPSVGVNIMLGGACVVVLILGVVVTGSMVGVGTIVGFAAKICGFVVMLCVCVVLSCGWHVIICWLLVIICGFDVVDVLKICDESDSIILPSLSANRMGRSRIAERSADVSMAESFALTTVIDDDAIDALNGVNS